MHWAGINGVAAADGRSASADHSRVEMTAAHNSTDANALSVNLRRSKITLSTIDGAIKHDDGALSMDSYTNNDYTS